MKIEFTCNECGKEEGPDNCAHGSYASPAGWWALFDEDTQQFVGYICDECVEDREEKSD